MSPPTQEPKRSTGGNGEALAVHRLDRIHERFVEHRQHAVQHVGEIEGDVLELVGHGGLVRAGFRRSASGGQRQAHALDVGAALLRRAGAVDVVDQALDDVAFLLQQRTAHGFGGMRGEHRLDAHARQQGLHVREVHAVGTQLPQDDSRPPGCGALPMRW